MSQVKDEQPRILIAGAGIGGLSTALCLHAAVRNISLHTSCDLPLSGLMRTRVRPPADEDLYRALQTSTYSKPVLNLPP